MTDTEIEAALQGRLATLTGVELVYENQIAGPARPYIAVEHVPTNITNPALSGATDISRGYMALTIITGENQFVTESRALAEQIKTLFPYGLKFAAGDGVVTINRPVQRIKGYPQDAEYRMPVRVFYAAS